MMKIVQDVALKRLVRRWDLSVVAEEWLCFLHHANFN